MAATLQFVDSIATSPTLRLDINDVTIWLLEVEGTDFSPPSLKTATADIILNDGAFRSASSYGNRRLKLRLSLKATSEDDKATKLRALHGELNRTCNILKYQPGTTPLFFRTLRSPEYGLDETATYALTYVSLDIEAEPFAYGLMQTAANALTINHDPAAGSNNLSLDITGVLGDVDTPAQIKWPTAGTALVAMRHSTAAPTLLFAQAEAGSAITDAALAAANDPAMSGAGNNYLRSSFGSTPLTDRWAVTVGTAGTALRGTYRVYLRWRKSVATDTHTFRLTLRDTISGTVNVVGAVITEAGQASTGPFWTDLGLFQIPMGEDPGTDGYTGSALPCATVSARVGIGRTAGTGTVDSDVLVFVPADTSLGFFGAAPTGTNVVADGPTDTFYTLSGANLSSQGRTRVGAIPSLRPGVHNQLVFFRALGSTSSGSDSGVTATTVVTVNYWPRYLTV